MSMVGIWVAHASPRLAHRALVSKDTWGESLRWCRMCACVCVC